MFISDEQWEVLGPLLEWPRKSKYGTPRPMERTVFEALLFVLHTGIQWKDFPKTFPPKSTVHDYLKAWSQSDACRQILAAIISNLVDQGRVNLEECFIDATFAAAKGGGEAVGLTRKGKDTKVQLIVDRKGFRWPLPSIRRELAKRPWFSRPSGLPNRRVNPSGSLETRAMTAMPWIGHWRNSELK